MERLMFLSAVFLVSLSIVVSNRKKNNNFLRKFKALFDQHLAERNNRLVIKLTDGCVAATTSMFVVTEILSRQSFCSETTSSLGKRIEALHLALIVFGSMAVGASARAFVETLYDFSRTFPRKWELKGFPLARQATAWGCGVAATQAVYHYLSCIEVNDKKEVTAANGDIRQDCLTEELKANDKVGTAYENMVKFLQAKGLTVDVRKEMTLEELKSSIASDKPVVVALQAWGDNDENKEWRQQYKDGHYAVAIGYNESRKIITFMDPSTFGHITEIPEKEFLVRWHDQAGDDGEEMRETGDTEEKPYSVATREKLERLGLVVYREENQLAKECQHERRIIMG